MEYLQKLMISFRFVTIRIDTRGILLMIYNYKMKKCWICLIIMINFMCLKCFFVCRRNLNNISKMEILK